MKHRIRTGMRLATFLALLLSAPVGFSQTLAQDAVSRLPTEYSRGSSYVIRYDDWDLILSSSVLETGLSDREPASRRDKRNVATRIRHTNMSSTSFEANRVMFNLFDAAHEDSLLAIRRDLESTSDFVPLEEFSKNEQLAYWLNLHNVAVVYEIAKAYPIKKIKSLVKGRKSVWDKKTMSIGGVPTSIRDIEDHVVANWNDPLVLYGLFMGTIGGPNIRSEAYTGDNVVDALRENAVDFVNSLRGFRLWSGYGRVSDHYELGRHYFPDFDEDMKRHLMKFANGSALRALAKADTFRIKNYDWGIADLRNGSVYAGPSFNTSAAALWAFVQAPHPNGSGALITVPGLVTLGDHTSVTRAGAQSLDPQTYALLRAMKKRDERRIREGEVTVEEFVSEDGGRVTTKDVQKKRGTEEDDAPDDGGVIIAD